MAASAPVDPALEEAMRQHAASTAAATTPGGGYAPFDDSSSALSDADTAHDYEPSAPSTHDIDLGATAGGRYVDAPDPYPASQIPQAVAGGGRPAKIWDRPKFVRSLRITYTALEIAQLIVYGFAIVIGVLAGYGFFLLLLVPGAISLAGIVINWLPASGWWKWIKRWASFWYWVVRMVMLLLINLGLLAWFAIGIILILNDKDWIATYVLSMLLIIVFSITWTLTMILFLLGWILLERRVLKLAQANQ